MFYELAAAAATNDNNLVELVSWTENGVVRWEIVFKTGLRPDYESVRSSGDDARTDGKYVFVVKAVSNSKPDDADVANRQSRAGRKETEQTYEFNVADLDEAPWNVEISSRGITSDGSVGTLGAANDAGETTEFTLLSATLKGLGRIVGFGEPQNPDFDISQILEIDSSGADPVLRWKIGAVSLTGGILWYEDSSGQAQRHVFSLGDAVTVTLRASDGAGGSAALAAETKSRTVDFEIVNGSVSGLGLEGLMQLLIDATQNNWVTAGNAAFYRGVAMQVIEQISGINIEALNLLPFQARQLGDIDSRHTVLVGKDRVNEVTGLSRSGLGRGDGIAGKITAIHSRSFNICPAGGGINPAAANASRDDIQSFWEKP